MTVCLCRADGLTAEQPQTGYQDSQQTYHSLVPQNGQFSPDLEGSHSPFLTAKGANALQSRPFSLQVYPHLSVVQALNSMCESSSLQVKPTIRVTRISCMILTGSDKRRPSGPSSPLRASLAPNHTLQSPPAPQTTALIPRSSTAPVW